MKNYDVIVIGSGGGAKITSPAARLGYKVAVIEKDRLGGTCLNRGCIPSKMLIHPADVAHEIKHAKRFDIHNDPNFEVNFATLVARISETVDGDSDKIAASYDKHPNIDYYHSKAHFISDKVIALDNDVGAIHESPLLTAKIIIIAVGARPHIPNIPGLEGTPYMTSTEALRNTTLPKSMVVVGGGYIGTELGYAYSALGCETHFLVRSKMLRAEDDQVAEEFIQEFSKHHHVHLGASPTEVSHDGKAFTVTYSQNNETKTINCEALLIATGVVSNADTLQLQNTGIETDDRNQVKVNGRMQTAVDGVYAIGDCVGNYYFRHSVNFEGEYLFNEIFVNPTGKDIEYPPVPHAVFTNPQIAGVGLTEQECQSKNLDYVVGLNPYKSSAMGMALLSDHGFCKLLIERGSQKILGCHIIGPEASNMIHMVIALMTKNGNLDDLLNIIYIHPALPEIVRNAARKAKAALDK